MTRSLLLLPLAALTALAGTPAPHAQAPLLTLQSPTPKASGFFGISVSGVPDADGDGRGDLLVGARNETDGAASGGRAYLFSGATGTALRTLISPTPEASGQFGNSVSGVPDADGDGRGDLLVGAPLENGGATDAGRAYLFSGTTGASLRTLASPTPEQGGQFGSSVAGVADADGDGRGDLLVGASRENGGATDAGRAYLFSGATGALLRTLVSPAPAASGFFGVSVSGVPDADGDGRGDLLVGASQEAGGRAYLFSGATGALLRTLTSPGTPVGFGSSVSGVPDADGDGRGDLLVGAPGETAGTQNGGRAHLFSGATGTLLRTLTSSVEQGSGGFGTSVSGVGDVDGDGRGDLVVGAIREVFSATPTAGRAHLFSGATGARLGTPVSPNPEVDGFFGISVSGVPDADGDGRGDIVVGAYFEDGGAANAGRSYLFSGRVPVASEPGVEGAAFEISVVPNPAQGLATLTLMLLQPGTVTVGVFDVLGRRVAVLHEGALAAGPYALPLDVSGLPSGVYLVRLTVGDESQTRRITVRR